MVTEKISNLLSEYFDLAFAEGKEGRNHDTEAGDAQRVLSELEAAIAALSTDAEPVVGKIQVHYAYCCPGSTKYCDCVNKNHGTAWIGENEVGDDYIPVAPPAPSVAVKDLVWQNSDEERDDVWSCVSDLAERYSITRWWLDDSRDEVGHFEVEELGERQFGTIEEAKAAAQADYEARIRSALSAQVQDVAGWEFKTMSAGRKSGTSHKDVWPDGDGWEIDTRKGRVGGPDAGWERFENHEELYFRRRLAAAPAAKLGEAE